MPLSRAQRSNVFWKAVSARDVLAGSVFVRMLSQRRRMACSWSISISPCQTWSRNFLIRSDRSFQLFTKGSNTSESPIRRRMQATAPINSIFWRFLVSIGVSSSLPLKIKCELLRRLSAHLLRFQVRHFRRGLQLVNQRDVGPVVAGHTGASDRRKVADLQV